MKWNIDVNKTNAIKTRYASIDMIDNSLLEQ